MKIKKQVVTLTMAFAITAVIVSSNAFAMLLPREQAPMSSIDLCLAQIAAQANYKGAGRVRHDVDSKKRHSSGYKFTIDTKVFAESGEDVIRGYVTICAITDNEQMKQFTIEETGA